MSVKAKMFVLETRFVRITMVVTVVFAAKGIKVEGEIDSDLISNSDCDKLFDSLKR